MSLKKELEQIFHDFTKEYKQFCDVSRIEYIKNLDVGAQTPPEGRIYGEHFINEFERQSAVYLDKAAAYIDKKLDETLKAKTKAPSNDVVSILTLLASRNNVSESDINDILSTYGDNYQVYRSLQDISKKNNIPFYEEHPLVAKEQSLTDIKKSASSFLTLNGISKYGESFGEFVLANIPEEL